MFPPDMVRQWVNRQDRDGHDLADDLWTALCPECGIDSVIGDRSGFPITQPTFLADMHRHWFDEGDR